MPPNRGLWMSERVERKNGGGEQLRNSSVATSVAVSQLRIRKQPFYFFPMHLRTLMESCQMLSEYLRSHLARSCSERATEKPR